MVVGSGALLGEFLIRKKSHFDPELTRLGFRESEGWTLCTLDDRQRNNPNQGDCADDRPNYAPSTEPVFDRHRSGPARDESNRYSERKVVD